MLGGSRQAQSLGRIELNRAFGKSSRAMWLEPIRLVQQFAAFGYLLGRSLCRWLCGFDVVVDGGGRWRWRPALPQVGVVARKQQGKVGGHTMRLGLHRTPQARRDLVICRCLTFQTLQGLQERYLLPPQQAPRSSLAVMSGRLLPERLGDAWERSHGGCRIAKSLFSKL